MAHTNLRYVGLKVVQAAQEAAAALSSAGKTLPEAVAHGLEAYRLPLTSVMLLTGAAMAPTLNPKGASQPEAVERLLVRLLPRPSDRSVHTGDVVAFTSPFTAAAVAGGGGLGGGGLGVAGGALGPEALQATMVRRVAAMPGEELVAGEGEEGEETYVVPEGHCWVLADNAELAPPHVIDSRSFGPLPLANIVGRILYCARSETDHGPVENSEEALAADAPVLEAELDLGRLCGDA